LLLEQLLIASPYAVGAAADQPAFASVAFEKRAFEKRAFDSGAVVDAQESASRETLETHSHDVLLE
jgi:hypothetical protein